MHITKVHHSRNDLKQMPNNPYATDIRVNNMSAGVSAIPQRIDKFSELPKHYQMEKDPVRLLKHMNIAISKLDTATFRLTKQERIRDTLKYGELQAKFARSPRQLYVKLKEPRPNTELLWKEGDNQALIKNGSFPRVTVSLGIYNSMMIDGNHHPVPNTSFCYFAGIITHLQRKYKLEAGEMLYYKELHQRGTGELHELRFENPHYTISEHIMEEDQKLVDFAYERQLSSFKLMELNRMDIDYKVKKGRKIRVTNDYAQSLNMHLCTDTHLPLLLEVFDEKGLFQKYEFHDVEVNPQFAENEFSRHHEEYNF